MKRYVRAADRGDALIGLYWYTDDCRVIGVSQPVDDGELDGQYIQYSDGNHMTMWRSVVRDNFDASDQSSIIDKGFKSMYRGRCIYSTITQTFIVTCSADLIDNTEFKADIREYFQLQGNRIDFEPLGHYRYKTELTGNPAVDSHYFDW